MRAVWMPMPRPKPWKMGITDSIFRSLHSKYFPGVDRYYTPFLSPTVHRGLTAREAREIPRADTLTYEAVPQLLTKVSEDFLWLTGVCADLGYKEVNLNTGCPSGTVTAKGKGSGMLRDLPALEAFLDDIFAKSPLPVSIKPRIGFYDPDEFPAILDVFNDYPICELTVHPRVRKDFYNGSVNMDSFRYCLQNSKNPVCYNGNLCSISQIEAFCKEFSIPMRFFGVSTEERDNLLALYPESEFHSDRDRFDYLYENVSPDCIEYERCDCEKSKQYWAKKDKEDYWKMKREHYRKIINQLYKDSYMKKNYQNMNFENFNIESNNEYAVNVAKAFNEKLKLTGMVMSKLDGDARGGSALSIKHLTGIPIKYAGVGEKLDDLEPFDIEQYLYGLFADFFE